MGLTFALALLNATLPTAGEALPSYGYKSGDVLTFKVNAKAEIQPYGIGGILTVKLTEKTPGKLWNMELNHKTEFVADGQRSPGQEQMAIFETTPNLMPTGAGQGMLMFGDQLAAILVLPTEAEMKLPIFTDRSVFKTTSTKDDKFVKVTSAVTDVTGTHTVDRYLDIKTMKLVKAKCVTKNATGLITYELSPAK